MLMLTSLNLDTKAKPQEAVLEQCEAERER